MQASLVFLYLLDSEGSQGAQVVLQLCVWAWQGLQQPGEHLVGLWVQEDSLFPGCLAGSFEAGEGFHHLPGSTES